MQYLDMVTAVPYLFELPGANCLILPKSKIQLFSAKNYFKEQSMRC